MNQINYMRVLSQEESDKFDQDLLNWVKKSLKDSNKKVYLFNLLSAIRNFWEGLERENKDH